MVMLAAMALECGCNPSDTPEQQHDTLPLPLGGVFVRHCGAAAPWDAGLRHFRGRRNQGRGEGGSNMAGGLSIVSGR